MKVVTFYFGKSKRLYSHSIKVFLVIQAINFLPGHFYFCYIVTRNINSLIFILTFFCNFLLLRGKYCAGFFIYKAFSFIKTFSFRRATCKNLRFRDSHSYVYLESNEDEMCVRWISPGVEWRAISLFG